ncbi:MAG TPA: hypothetical protein VKB72_06840 [Steroidobacteraceae bacterium]|nr:hypothetical protein [Steroidobacteraceae bacterium]
MRSEDRQRWRTMQWIDASAQRGAQSREHSGGVLDGALENLLNSPLSVAFATRRHAIVNESIAIEAHNSSPARRHMRDGKPPGGVGSAVRSGNAQHGAT